jgi:hypothetical protein
MASMVIVVNSVLGGAIVVLVCTIGIKLPLGAGVAAGLVLLGISLRLEYRRVSPLVLGSAPGPGRQLMVTGRN